MTTKKKIVKYKIIDGPNRSTLFANCEYAYDRESHVTANFTIIRGYTRDPHAPGAAAVTSKVQNVKLLSISHESDSGHSFNLAGFCDVALIPNRTPKHYQFSAYYDARSREGIITLISND